VNNLRIKKTSHIENFADAITHGIGLFFSIMAALTLFIVAAFTQDALKIVGLNIYGMSLVSTYLASTIYHLYLYYHPVPNKQFRRFLLLFDHCSIFLLIAGTYTPLLLIFVQTKMGYLVFISLWSLTGAGIIYKFLYVGRFKRFSLFMYAIMGWAILVVIKDILILVPMGLLGMLLAGGIFYSSGILFFQNNKLAFSHAIWHIFVLLGSLCHFIGILVYTL
jgi:hemolysin III